MSSFHPSSQPVVLIVLVGFRLRYYVYYAIYILILFYTFYWKIPLHLLDYTCYSLLQAKTSVFNVKLWYEWFLWEKRVTVSECSIFFLILRKIISPDVILNCLKCQSYQNLFAYQYAYLSLLFWVCLKNKLVQRSVTVNDDFQALFQYFSVLNTLYPIIILNILIICNFINPSCDDNIYSILWFV